MPAIIAASSSVRSLDVLREIQLEAASTPYAPWPQYILLQYIVKISCFVYRFSICIASSASLIFRSSVSSSVRKSLRVSCWVIVLAPPLRCTPTRRRAAVAKMRNDVDAAVPEEVARPPPR